MTIKAEIENLSVFGTVKNVAFFMDARSSSMINSFFQSLDSISLSRATCKRDFVLMAACINNLRKVLEPLQQKQIQTLFTILVNLSCSGQCFGLFPYPLFLPNIIMFNNSYEEQFYITYAPSRKIYLNFKVLGMSRAFGEC